MRVRRQRSQAVCAIAISAVFLSGCGTTADIYINHDRVVTGQIVEADSEQIFVRREMNEGGMVYLSPNETVIPKKQIVSVDHPGNILLTVGLITTALGGGFVRANSGTCGGAFGTPCALTYIPVVTGIIMSVWGLAVWVGSTTAYMPKIIRPRASRDD